MEKSRCRVCENRLSVLDLNCFHEALLIYSTYNGTSVALYERPKKVLGIIHVDVEKKTDEERTEAERADATVENVPESYAFSHDYSLSVTDKFF